MKSPDVLMATWAGGGNLPPLLSVARLLVDQGCAVGVLTSTATEEAAKAAGLDVVPYVRSPQPNMTVTFESHAAEFMAATAGPDMASEVRDSVRRWQPRLLVADCMLPAALAAGKATETPTVSVVHFLYGPARERIASGSGWTTDFRQLNLTRVVLGLAPLAHPIEAWEEPELVLVTAPRWFDHAADFPPHVLHAGPLGIRSPPPLARARSPSGDGGRRRVLIGFSTTAMPGQLEVLQAVCEACDLAGVAATLTLGPAIDARSVRAPARVTVVPFAAHDDALHACAAVITHAGLGTTLRAIAHGVPLLMLPLGRDQHINAARVAGLGAGIVLAAQSPPAAIAAALVRLLDDARFRAAAAAAAARIDAEYPDTTAAAALGRVGRLRGESHPSGAAAQRHAPP
jgi:Erythromycin biosynthesis protein CIII-like, C-terminal domain